MKEYDVHQYHYYQKIIPIMPRLNFTTTVSSVHLIPSVAQIVFLLLNLMFQSLSQQHLYNQERRLH